VRINIQSRSSVEIVPGQVKYAVSIDAKHKGGPGRLGTIAPIIPRSARMIAIRINMVMAIVMITKRIVDKYCEMG